VLLGGSSEYRVGLFDGEKFISESPKVPGHRGKGFYAAQSFSDVPDGRRILMGWFQTETKGMPFNQSMTIPLELGLTETDDGPRLTYTPAKELEVLRAMTHRFDPMLLSPGDKNPLAGIRAELIELRAEIEPAGAGEVVFNIRGVMIIYDRQKQELSVAGHRAPAPLQSGKQRLTIFCDRTGFEVFASDGLCYVPMPFNANPEDRRISLEARGGAANVVSLEVHELRSAWQTK
jgi:sucrose-6-phosphate hydrolase SacC (GH32 family)